MYCAGADPNYRPFLAEPVESALAMVQRNCVRAGASCATTSPAPWPLGVRAASCWSRPAAGSSGRRTWSPTAPRKAFDMVMAEALWAELHDQGVDVLGLVLGPDRHPGVAPAAGAARPAGRASTIPPVPGATSAEAVAADAIANLANGPTWLAGDDVRMGFEHLGAMPRNDAVRLMIEVAGAAMGGDAGEEMTP